MQSRERDRQIWYLHIKAIFFTDVLSSGLVSACVRLDESLGNRKKTAILETLLSCPWSCRQL